MKNYKSLILGALAVCTLAGCSDDKYNELFDDPDKTTQVTCAKLMTGTFYDRDGRDYTFNAYWRVYTWDNIFGKYAQTCGYKNNSGSVYYYNDGYASDRWTAFYKRLAQFRNLEDVYNNEPASEQVDDVIFKNLAEVFILDHLSQLCDLFGDIPYFKAGMLGITGNVVTSRAAFDDDVELYRHMLDRLGELYTEISTFSPTKATTNSALRNQDYICNGDLDKWAKYANSLRLRIAVRVASQGDLTSAAQTAIQECVERNLITDAYDQVEVKSDLDGFNFWENFRDGYKDINNVASQPMIDAMQKIPGTDDPRLKLMYAKNKDGNYVGTNRTETNIFQTNNGSAFNGFGNGAWADRYYSYLDSATYTDNHLFISPIITAAEVDFLLAECYQRGWAAGDAKQAFVNGVLNSIKFYYVENNTYPTAVGSHYDYPTIGSGASVQQDDTEFKAYAEDLWNAYGDKLEAILTHKWVNFGIIQPAQAWCDIRRTGYPALSYPEDEEASSVKNLPNRIKYPNSEAANNAANYADVVSAQGDELTIKLFWAK